MKKIILLSALFLLLLIIPVSSEGMSKSMKLLAVSEIGDGAYKGSIADLNLEIREGNGAVFVNTFPISKIDTQISMRFAKQIACKYAEADCTKHDFIYTIKASSGIVGGPSAGSAAAILTAVMLQGENIDEEVAITGTINSGELIGPVGGLKEKIDAAAQNNIKKVLIPVGESIETNESNSNLTNLIQLGNDLGIEVIEITTLDEAMYYFTGKRKSRSKKTLEVDNEYESVMKKLSGMLCERSDELQEEYLLTKPQNNFNTNNSDSILSYEESAIEDLDKAKQAFENKDYYTSASFCFRANINFRYLWNYMQNMSIEKIEEMAETLEYEITEFEEFIDAKQINTITDLQAYMITKERIDEAREKQKVVMQNINNTRVSTYWMAFANERLYSAFSWSHFFGAKGQEFIINEEVLKETCSIKISEADERYQYVNFYFPDTLTDTKDEIDRAKQEAKDHNYIMCLYKASLAKAQSNVVLSLIGVDAQGINNTLSLKIEAAERTIIEQQEFGIFPIMGYSYLEYAKSLKDEEQSSAMIYAEYALELSSFDFYFEKKSINLSERIDTKLLFVLIIGICLGFLIGKRARKKEKDNSRVVSVRKTKSKLRKNKR